LPSLFEPVLCLELKISPRHVSKTSVYGHVSVTRIEDFLDPNTPTLNSQRAPLGAHRYSALLFHRNRLATTGKKLPVLTIGLSTKVIAVFAESLHQSDRDCSTKVIVDKSLYPNDL
jgi:hypothetical protein